MPPFWMFIVLFSAIYISLSLVLTRGFGLPWQVPMPWLLEFGLGLPLLVLGAGLMIRAFQALGLKRAFGKELFLPQSESKLVTEGVYAHTRNPLYLSATLLFLGWFFVTRLTPLLFLTILFLAHFLLIAKWEERELRERFGREYEKYRDRVPLFLPRCKKSRRDPG